MMIGKGRNQFILTNPDVVEFYDSEIREPRIQIKDHICRKTENPARFSHRSTFGQKVLYLLSANHPSGFDEISKPVRALSIIFIRMRF